MNPGMNAPRYSRTMDSPALAAYKISSTLGGMRMPSVPPAAIAPEARRLSYPSLSMGGGEDRKSTRLNSSHLGISYAVFCVKKKDVWPADEGRAENRCVGGARSVGEDLDR